MYKFYTIIASALFSTAMMNGHAQIVINEVMQSNVYSIMDDLNDFPDSWVELYNAGEQTVNLSGYKINVKDKIKSAYELPNYYLVPGATFLLYCDKVGEGKHASFRIDSGKGNVILYGPDGNIVDQVALKKQPAPEVAYGRETDGGETWGYELIPTPGSPNEGGLTETVLGDVVFSIPGGVWSQPTEMEVELKLPKKAPENAIIIYTTDGSEPQPGVASVYDSPISITDSKVIRAKAVAEGCISVPSTVQSYIFTYNDTKLPVISLAIDEKYLYDEEIGILAYGNVGELNENWRQDWRRPLNIEYFDGLGQEAAINQLGETRVHGGMSRTNKLKSLAVYANKRFGTKNFDHVLWAADKPGLKGAKSFVLRNGGNDFSGCYMRDGLIQRVIGRNTNVDWQGYSPVVVYINGQYHAMMAVRERSNEDYVEANYDGLEDIDMYENWEELKAGDENAMQELSDFVYGDHTFEQWAEYINVESFANLMSINYWVYNADFPMNNVVLWRRTDGADPRWRWIVKDCDYGLGLWNQNDFLYRDFSEFLYSNVGPYVGFDIYQQLMRTDFREYFINRLIVYTGDFMNAKTFNAYIDEIMDSARDEMVRSHAIWGNFWDKDVDYNVDFMRQWINARNEFMPQLIRNSFDLGKEVKVNINQALSDEMLEDVEITYNDVPLTHGVFDGYDYTNRTIKLNTTSEFVKGWQVNLEGEEFTVNGTELTLNITDERNIEITALFATTGVDEVINSTLPVKVVDGTVYSNGLIEIYTTDGRKVAEGNDVLTLPSKGIYIVKANSQTTKLVW